MGSLLQSTIFYTGITRYTVYMYIIHNDEWIEEYSILLYLFRKNGVVQKCGISFISHWIYRWCDQELYVSHVEQPHTVSPISRSGKSVWVYQERSNTSDRIWP
jgi:hypothetical protein